MHPRATHAGSGTGLWRACQLAQLILARPRVPCHDPPDEHRRPRRVGGCRKGVQAPPEAALKGQAGGAGPGSRTVVEGAWLRALEGLAHERLVFFSGGFEHCRAGFLDSAVGCVGGRGSLAAPSIAARASSSSICASRLPPALPAPSPTYKPLLPGPAMLPNAAVRRGPGPRALLAAQCPRSH